ncbi:LacI family DNA-binding transcriptional regulator [Novosphingobium lentum]|uniref:LacI family DNA-binding transcriptional regulator n=1 Tax=Novosphingobium lentum TaxID=145287 RepID=UPI000ADCB249|nr:LacI family DNA-binding transcriptional regulator [Novosphingobium lentum]
MVGAKRVIPVTMFDVADAAGVNQSTVSRALAGDTSISQATRLRIADAAERLGYVANQNAVRLRTGRTGTLAVVVVCRAEEGSRDINPFYFALLGSVCAAASAKGYETLVSFHDGPGPATARYVERGQADGLIVIGTTENRAAWSEFRQRADGGVPTICWGSPFDELEWVRSDNASGARLATEHLIAQGYRRIACVGSHVSPQRQFTERYEGFVAAMRDAGLEPAFQSIEEGLPREEQGRRAAAALVEGGTAFDAIYVVCDLIALGVLDELRRRDIAVPGRVGVAGFDGIRHGAHASPPLTTVEPAFSEAGDMLVDGLLQILQGQSPGRQRVPVALIVRGSSLRMGVAAVASTVA